MFEKPLKPVEKLPVEVPPVRLRVGLKPVLVEFPKVVCPKVV
jgi:hypothetical protein